MNSISSDLKLSYKTMDETFAIWDTEYHDTAARIEINYIEQNVTEIRGEFYQLSSVSPLVEFDHAKEIIRIIDGFKEWILKDLSQGKMLLWKDIPRTAMEQKNTRNERICNFKKEISSQDFVDLSSIILSVFNGLLSVNEAQDIISSRNDIVSLVRLFSETEINTSDAMVSFGYNNQIGGITIRDISNKNITHYTVHIHLNINNEA